MRKELNSLGSWRHGAVVCYSNDSYTKIKVSHCYDGKNLIFEDYCLKESTYEDVLQKVTSSKDVCPFAAIVPLDEDYPCSFYAKLMGVDYEYKFISYQTYSFLDSDNPWEICESDKIFKVENVDAFLIMGADYSFFIEFESK